MTKIKTIFNSFLLIFFNIIHFNKSAIHGGIKYLIILLIAIICSLIVRLDFAANFFINNYISNETFFIIKIISALYACFVFFNFLILSFHAKNFLFIIFVNKDINYYNNFINIIVNRNGINKYVFIISYLIYYTIISIISLLIVYINLISITNINVLGIYIFTNPDYYYLFGLSIASLFAIYIYLLNIRNLFSNYNTYNNISSVLKIIISGSVITYFLFLISF